MASQGVGPREADGAVRVALNGFHPPDHGTGGSVLSSSSDSQEDDVTYRRPAWAPSRPPHASASPAYFPSRPTYSTHSACSQTGCSDPGVRDPETTDQPILISTLVEEMIGNPTSPQGVYKPSPARFIFKPVDRAAMNRKLKFAGCPDVWEKYEAVKQVGQGTFG